MKKTLVITIALATFVVVTRAVCKKNKVFIGHDSDGNYYPGGNSTSN